MIYAFLILSILQNVLILCVAVKLTMDGHTCTGLTLAFLNVYMLIYASHRLFNRGCL